MNEKLLQNAAAEFLRSNKSSDEVTLPIDNRPGEFVTIKFEKKTLTPGQESFTKSISESSTISAYPSGVVCGNCGGSGRV